MSRKGLSDVVTNVLIILIVLVATIIAWNFIKPIITGVNLDTAQFTTQLSVPEEGLVLDESNNLLSIDIQRGAGEGDIAGFIFGLQDPNGVVRTFRQNITISQLEMRNFVVNYSEYIIDDVVSISVTPIYRNNQTGKEQVGIPIEQEIKNKAPLAPTVYTLPDGLVAHWRFDESWSDSENGLGGSLVGTQSNFNLTTKRIGTASASFPGTISDYVSVPNNAALSPSSFTIVAWVYPRSLTSTSGYINFIDKSTTSNGYLLRYNIQSSSFELYAVYGRTQRNLLTTQQTIQTNSWNFLTATIDSNSLTLDVNGNVESAPLTFNPYTASTNVLKIGDSLNGNIDEVMFFNRVLTPQEISDIRTKYNR